MSRPRFPLSLEDCAPEGRMAGCVEFAATRCGVARLYARSTWRNRSEFFVAAMRSWNSSPANGRGDRLSPDQGPLGVPWQQDAVAFSMNGTTRARVVSLLRQRAMGVSTMPA